MSDTVHYKGVLRKIERLDSESLEEQCKRLLENKDLPSYFDTYEEYLLDEYYQKMTIQNGFVYQVEKEIIDPDNNIFHAILKDNDEILFEVRYYNGGCGFDEAIEEAIKAARKRGNGNG